MGDHGRTAMRRYKQLEPEDKPREMAVATESNRVERMAGEGTHGVGV